MVPVGRSVAGGSFQEVLVPCNRYGEWVEFHRPADAAQHQMVAGPDHVDARRQDAVIGSSLACPAAQEVTHLFSDARPPGPVHGQIPRDRVAQELRRQQLAVAGRDMAVSGARRGAARRTWCRVRHGAQIESGLSCPAAATGWEDRVAELAPVAAGGTKGVARTRQNLLP